MDSILICGIVMCVMYLVLAKPKKKYTQSNEDNVLEYIGGKMWETEKRY